MHRTNIYITDAQHIALEARSVAEGRSRSEIVREILDRELNLVGDYDLDTFLLEFAVEVAERARELSAGDPDLRID